MARKRLYSDPGLVDIYFDEVLGAIWLAWFDEYDEDGRVQDAVKFALEYVRKHGVRNWVGDLSVSKRGLSEADQQWVSGEFQREILATPLKKLVLVPPRPETGQDTSWLGAWEESARARFEGRIQPRLLSEPEEIAVFFGQ